MEICFEKRANFSAFYWFRIVFLYNLMRFVNSEQTLKVGLRMTMRDTEGGSINKIRMRQTEKERQRQKERQGDRKKDRETERKTERHRDRQRQK